MGIVWPALPRAVGKGEHRGGGEGQATEQVVELLRPPGPSPQRFLQLNFLDASSGMAFPQLTRGTRDKVLKLTVQRGVVLEQPDEALAATLSRGVG